MLEELSRRDDWPRGSIERLLGDDYASCMDEARVERLGLEPLDALLADIDAIRDRTGPQRSIQRLHGLAIPIAFGVVGVLDNHEPERFIANVVPGKMGLSSRDAYLQSEPRFVQERGKCTGRASPTSSRLREPRTPRPGNPPSPFSGSRATSPRPLSAPGCRLTRQRPTIE